MNETRSRSRNISKCHKQVGGLLNTRFNCLVINVLRTSSLPEYVCVCAHAVTELTLILEKFNDWLSFPPPFQGNGALWASTQHPAMYSTHHTQMNNDFIVHAVNTSKQLAHWF